MPRKSRSARFKPDGHHGNRIRTSSQSSVEIQVTDHDTLSILTHRLPQHRPDNRQHRPDPRQHRPDAHNMVLPTREFLHLLKKVGAQGLDTACGELFTFQQLCFHLKEYIKQQELYDPEDPLMVHCENDPLGLIFGVKQFTFQDALPLVKRNTLVIDNSFTRRRHMTPPRTHQAAISVNTLPQNTTEVNISSTLSAHYDRPGVQRSSCRNQVTSTTTTTLHQTYPPKHLPGALSETDDEQFSSRLQYNPASAVKQLFLDENANTDLRDECVSNTKIDQESGEVEPVESRTSPSPQVKGQAMCSCGHAARMGYSSLGQVGESTAERGDISVNSSCNCGQQEVKGQKQCSSGHKQTEVKVESVSSEHVGPLAGPSHREDVKKDKKSSDRNRESRKRRKRTKSDRVSESRHSFSIYYQSEDEDGKTTQPWCLEVELGGDSDSGETIYSIQSKETVYVKDSSDDLWFLDEEDEISFEIQSTQSAYYQEYEVPSEVESNHGDHDYQSDGSESPIEDFVVVCDDSDQGFWADSESSDSEQETTDEELQPGDKWKCEKCELINRPLSRYCNRCWEVREGWLPEQPPQAVNKRSQNDHSQPNSTSDSKWDCHRSKSPPLEGKDLSALPGASNRDYSKNIMMDRFLSSQIAFSPLSKVKAAQGAKLEPKSCGVRERWSTSTMPVGATSSITRSCEPGYSPLVKSDTPLSRSDIPLSRSDTSLSRSDTPLSRSDTPLLRSDIPLLRSDTPLSRSDTLPIGDLFKVPSSPLFMGKEESKCTAKGRLLPRLKLPMNDSGVCSLSSSQESVSTVSGNSLSQELIPGSPVKRARLSSPMARIPLSPRKPPASPCKRPAYPDSPFSNKHNQFAFDHLPSPIKRPYLSDSHTAGSVNFNAPDVPKAIMSSPKPEASPMPESSRRIFFVDPLPSPLPSPKKRAANGVEYSDVCMICLSKPKEASIIHGKTGHQVCCYLCAKQLRRRGRPCPVCRRPIQKVIKNYLV